MALFIFINWYHIFVYLYFYWKTYNKEIYIFTRIILLPSQRVWTAWGIHMHEQTCVHILGHHYNIIICITLRLGMTSQFPIAFLRNAILTIHGLIPHTNLVVESLSFQEYR